MFCFGTPNRKARLKYFNDHTILVHAEAPSNPEQYMPHLSKHIVQEEPELIDDPSSIFFDPHEKSGFVYTAVPFLTSTYSKYTPEQVCQYPSYPDISDISNKHLSNALESRHVKDSPISSDYDDSLDRTRSLQNTPTCKTSESIFQDQFDVSSRKDSLEYDPIGMDSDYHVALNQNEAFTPNIKSPIGVTEEEVKKLYESSHEGSLVDDFPELNLYEDEILQSYKTNTKIRGYLSDAESTKTYQDSGIYDDDVFIDSPKHLINEEYTSASRKLVFGADDEEDGYVERFSAFKTPMSSRQNSFESILSLNSPLEKEPVKASLKHITTIERPWKTTDKYSHIPAKVQCHRTKSDRSPSPGATLKKKSPSTAKPPMVFGKLNKRSSPSKSNTSISAKVDSLSNLKYERKGGEKKIFKERLNFRENAKARTDSHGIEMYSHLPAEFQEIARRLARQDHQLKRQESQRGRSLSRSRTSSRQSSISPTRGRTRVRRYSSKKLTPGNSISDIFAAVNSAKVLTETQNNKLPHVSLSRSSSCRSIPSTPLLSRQHPSTTLRQGQKSPSPGPSPARRKETKTTGATKEKLKGFDTLTGLQLKTTSDYPSPVSKLYQFTTQNDSFGSPQYTTNAILQTVSVR